MREQRLFKDTVLTLISLVIFGSTNFLFNVVIGRVYGSAYLGKVSTALSTSLLLSYIVSTSFPGAVSKYVSEYLGRKREREANYVLETALKYGVAIGLITTIFALIFSEQLCQIFHMSKDLFLLTIPIIILYGLYMILKMAYYGYRNVDKYFKNEIVADSLFFIALAILAIFHAQSFVYIPYILLYSYFILSALYFFHNKLLGNKPSEKREVEKKFFIFAGISFVGTFSSMAMRNLSIMLSSRYVAPSDVGYLTAAFSLSTIFFLFPNAIGRVLMPEFSYTFGKGDREKMVKLLNTSTEYLAVLVTVVNSLGIIFSSFLVWLFYSNEYQPSVLLLQILLASYWISMVGRPAVSVLSGSKYVHHPNIGGVVGLITGIISWIVLIPLWGIVGATVGYSLSILAKMLYILFFAWKKFELNLWIILKHWVWILAELLIFLTPLSPYNKLLLSLITVMVYLLIENKLLIRLIHKIFTLL